MRKNEGLNGHLATHVTDEEEAQIKALAQFDGLEVSRYLRKLVIEHLDEKRTCFERMQKVFSPLSSVSSAKGKQ